MKMFFLFLLLFSPLYCFAQDVTPAAGVKDTRDQSLTLTIKSDKEVHSKNDSIHIYYYLKNVSNKNVVVPRALFKTGDMGFSFYEKGSKKIIVQPFYALSMIPTYMCMEDQRLVIKPNEIVEGFEDLLNLKWDLYELIKPGMYELQLKGRMGCVYYNDTIISNVIPIQVVEKKALSDGFMAGIQIVEADSALQQKVDDILRKQVVLRENVCSSDVVTLEQAAECVSKSINMAYPPAACVSLREWFFFSGGLSAAGVSDFSQGMAIKKGERTVYKWER